MLKAFLLRGAAAAVLVAGIATAAPAQDAADLLVRTNRLENMVRQLSGQIEQLQFENRRLTDQLRKFQEDVDFRLNERGGRGGASANPGGAPGQGATPQGQRQKRSDAFDPSTQTAQPGAPRNLGGSIGAVIDEEIGSGAQQPLDLQGVGRPVPQGGLPPREPAASASVAATGEAPSPRQAYEVAYASYQRKEYEQAEMGFRQFLQSYPRDRLAADATYWLGESYLQRQRFREAAEQFFKVSRDNPKAGKAPESLLKLGIALNGLGARDQACATYAKVAVDYPAASDGVRRGVERERRRANCA